MANTTRLQLPFPALGDTADVPRDIGALAQALDPNVAVANSGTFAARPAPGTFGRFYFATDRSVLYFDIATAWVAIGTDDPIPVGQISAFGGSVAPAKWLLCDGSTVVTASYPALSAVCGTAFNTGGEPTDSFRLPDLRGRALLGSGAGAGLTARAVGARGGVEAVQLTSAQSGMPSHTHADTFAVANAAALATGTESADHVHSYSYAASSGTASRGQSSSASPGGGQESVAYTNHAHAINLAGTTTGGRSAAHTHTLPAHGHTLNGVVSAVAAVNAASAHDNMTPWLAVGAIIKAL